MARRPTFGDPGRPALPASKRARHNAGIWLDDATYKAWRARAYKADLSLGEWIRQTVAKALKRSKPTTSRSSRKQTEALAPIASVNL